MPHSPRRLVSTPSHAGRPPRASPWFPSVGALRCLTYCASTMAMPNVALPCATTVEKSQISQKAVHFFSIRVGMPAMGAGY